MNNNINILIIEDSEQDTLLIMHELQKSVKKILFERVEDEKNLISALENKNFDIVISDYSMPGFDGIAALKIVREMKEDIPFIMVSGTIGEDIAVESMKLGANDYVMKNNLKRLNSAVQRELKEYKIKKERRIISKQLKKSEELYRTLVETSSDAIVVIDSKGKILFANSYSVFLTGYSNVEELIGKNITEVIHPEDIKTATTSLLKAAEGKNIEQKDYRLIRKDKKIVFVEISESLIPDDSEEIKKILVIVRDITERKQAEIQLAQEHNLLKTVINNIPDVIYVKDTAGRKILTNKADLGLIGKTEEEVIGKTDYELFPPNVASQLSADDKLVLKDGNSIINREELINNNRGESSWLLTSKLPLRDNKGDIIGLVGIGHNITEHKLSEKKLEESEKYLRIAQEIAHIGHWRLNLQNNELYWSDEIYRIFGIEPQSINISLEQFLEFVHPDDKEQVLTAYNKSIEFKTPHNIEYRIIKANKDIIHVHEQCETEYNKNGIALYSIGTIHDITKRKLAEESTIASEQQFRSIWENSFDGMRLCDENGIIIMANAAFCKLMNKPREEIEGKLFNSVYIEKKNSVSPDDFKFSFSSRSINTKLETEIQLWDKKKIWVELSNSFIETKNLPPLLLSIFRDITERKNYENNLLKAKNNAEEMERLKTNFFNNMSHEMRTPLVAILGYSQFLLSEIKDEEYKEMLRNMEESGKRLFDTISSILDFSKVESKKLNLVLIEADLYKEVELVLKRLSILTHKKNLYLRLEKKAENVISIIDVTYFIRILENLVSNAVKFTQEGGVTIVIDKKIINGIRWSIVEVVDTGIGLSENSINIIFDEFRQASEGYNRRFEGTGLGLTITKKLVEQMDGKIIVESELGKGSTFTIMFKSAGAISENINEDKMVGVVKNLMDKENFDKIISKKKLAQGAKDLMDKNGFDKIISKDYNILVVEDDFYCREVIRLFLKNLYNVEFAESGEKALMMAKTKRYDTILMDINLGLSMNGIETAKELKKNESYKNVPIIAITAYAAEEDKQKFLEKGFALYIVKPFERKHLQDTLKQAFNSVRVRD